MRTPTRSAAIIVVMMVLVLMGCASSRKPGFPAQSLNTRNQIAALEQAFPLENLIKNYPYDRPDVTQRDKIITAKLALTDLHYNEFVSNFAVDKQTIDTVTDIVILALTISATAVGGAGAKTVLSAVSAGVTGSKLAIDKNFYYEKTVAALVAAMNAQRKAALIPIMTGLTLPVSQYPLPMALTDLDSYYRAGTFLGALQAIQADAGAKELKAESELNKIRTTKFSDDAFRRALLKFWVPKWTPSAPPEEFEFNATNEAELLKWMKDNQLSSIPLASFINGAAFAELRKKAVEDLKIPVD